MIGTRAFLSDMTFPFICLFIMLAIAAVIFRSAQAKAAGLRTNKLRSTVAIVILIAGLVIGGLWIGRQLRYRAALQNLGSSSIDFIQVGEVRLENPSDVKAVVDALRSSQWYVHTAGDGGWARTVDLTIHFKSSEELRYRVSRLLKMNGAVISFISQDPNARFVGHYGYAYVQQLPEVLDHVGASLPAKRD